MSANKNRNNQVNDSIFFKPTSGGKKIIRDNGLGILIKKNTPWVRMQFWEFLAIFGEHYPKSPSVVKDMLIEGGEFSFEDPREAR